MIYVNIYKNTTQNRLFLILISPYKRPDGRLLFKPDRGGLYLHQIVLKKMIHPNEYYSLSLH